MITDEFKKMSSMIINDYIQKENKGKSLPIKEIVFSTDIIRDIRERDCDFNKTSSLTLSGYTALFSDNTASVIVDISGVTKNFFWIETLVHELTHTKDYCDYLKVLNYENIREMKKHRPFYFWTEFHARYKGFEYMLPYVLRLPEKYKQQYIYDTENRLKGFVDIKEKQCNSDEKIYYTMHIIGEILSYEKLSIYLDETLQQKITEKFVWFDETKAFLEKHTDGITTTEMVRLSMNMKNIFDEQECE